MPNLKQSRELWEKVMLFPGLISAVLLPINLVFLQVLISPGNMTTWETYSLLFFVVALPCLGANVVVMYWMTTKKKVLEGHQWLFGVIQWAGYVASGAGMTTTIMNKSVGIGLAFAVITFVLLLFCSKLMHDIDVIP